MVKSSMWKGPLVFLLNAVQEFSNYLFIIPIILFLFAGKFWIAFALLVAWLMVAKGTDLVVNFIKRPDPRDEKTDD